MDDADKQARRLALNLNVAALLAPKVAAGEVPTPKDINRAVQVASDIDSAVVKRLRWEARRTKGDSDTAPSGD